MPVNALSSASQPTPPPITTPQQQMGQDDFLRLMTAQLAQQDPFAPVDNQQMVAQMAQFSSLAGINDTNVVLQQISDQIAAQTELLQNLGAALTPAAATTQEG